MSAIELKLKQPGESVTMECTRCEASSIGQYPEVEFEGWDGSRAILVRVPKSSADRQLARNEYSYADCVNNTVTISRDPNKVDASKPYWGVNVIKGAGKSPPRTAQRPAVAAETLDQPPPLDDADAPDGATETVPTGAESILVGKLKQYDRCFAYAVAVAKRHNITDQQAIASMAATLYIQVMR